MAEPRPGRDEGMASQPSNKGIVGTPACEDDGSADEHPSVKPRIGKTRGTSLGRRARRNEWEPISGSHHEPAVISTAPKGRTLTAPAHRLPIFSLQGRGRPHMTVGSNRFDLIE